MRRTRGPWMLAMTLIAGFAHAAEIVTWVDRNPVAIGESFQLVFEGETFSGQPDLSELTANFDILGQSRNSSVNIANGRSTRTTQWTFSLMPKHAGVFTVPSIAFGTQRSEAIQIKVMPAGRQLPGKQAELFLEAEVDPPNPYVQAQLIYTLRFYHRVNISAVKLEGPVVLNGEAVVERLGEYVTYAKQINGVRYGVIERRYSVVPQRSGPLVLGPARFQGRINTDGRDLFAFGSFGRAGALRRLDGEALTVDVRPVPGGASRPWLPARALTLSARWAEDPPRFVVGEPVTLTLVLEAEGLPATQLPQLSLTLPEGFKQYPDKAITTDERTQAGNTGRREQKIALIPTQAGRYTLPEIRLDWWNTRTDRRQSASVPARAILVALGTQAAVAPTAPGAVANAAAPGATANMWRWLALAFALAWITTAWLWWRQRRLPAAPKQPAEQARRRALLRRIAQACRTQDAATCKAALLALGKLRWPQRPPASLGALAQRTGGALANEIRALEAALYSPGIRWQGGTLSEHLGVLRDAPVTGPPAAPDVLQPLYPA